MEQSESLILERVERQTSSDYDADHRTRNRFWDTMMTYPDEQTYCRLRDGTLKVLGPEDLLPDGASLVVSLQMRDQARAGGGSGSGIFMSDAERARAEGTRDAAYLSMCRRQATAWMPEEQRQASLSDRQPSQMISAVDAQLARDEALRGAIERQRNAWKTPYGG
jgi:hypothetical protein